MVDVSIKNAGGVTFTFLNAEVSLVKSEIIAQPDVIPMPGSAPLNAIIIDLGGCTKNITVTGQLIVAGTTRTSSGTTTTIAQQKYWLEGLLDGTQTPVTFTSNYEQYSNDGSAGWAASPPTATTATTVVITRLNIEEATENPNKIPFTMTLKVGGS